SEPQRASRPRVARMLVIAAGILLLALAATLGGARADTTPAPVDLSPRQVSGLLQEGQTLTATGGEWQNAIWFAYQWTRCDSDGANCNPIDGATAATYTLARADVGSSIGVQVSATNDFGSTSAGSVDDALAFDGTSSYVEAADNPSLRSDHTNAFTASFWVRLDSYDNNVLPRLWEKGANYMALMGDPTNGMSGRVAIEAANASGTGNTNGGVSEYWGSTVLQTGVWYHIVGVFDASAGGTNQGQIYINGVPETMRNIFGWSGTLRSSAGKDLYLARRGSDQSRNLQGQLDQFAYYTRALTANEIAQLNAGVPP